MATYDSPYRAELYDIGFAQEDSFASDGAVYWEAYREMRTNAPRHNSPYFVLDVGTGTGRIIRGLLDRSKNEKSSDETRFLGIDNSPHMLERARAAVASTDQDHISYQLASALDLKSAVSDSSVDLLLMAVGTISHFSKPGEAECLLEQVSQVLRPDSGRAYISVLHMCQSSTFENQPTPSEEQPWVVNQTSLSNPRIQYRQTYHTFHREGNVSNISSTLEVYDQTDPNAHRILHQDKSTAICRLWEDDELIRLAPTASLSHVKTIVRDNEHIYVFKKE